MPGFALADVPILPSALDAQFADSLYRKIAAVAPAQRTQFVS
jgi:hypothetical protein